MDQSSDRFAHDPALDPFFESTDDGVLYVGHASILVRLSGKTFFFDPVGYSSPYGGVWVFFPAQLMDPRLLSVDAVVVSHCHQDHFDVPFLRRFPATTKLYIVGGRPSFVEMMEQAGLKPTEIPAGALTPLGAGIEAYAILHDYNGVDASLVLRNANFSVYHGNDNYASTASLLELKQAVGRVDVGCVPFAYIHWYPFLLDGVDDAWREQEARRLMDHYLDIGIEQAEALDAEVVMPFGANLIYYDDVDSVMNRAVLSPLDLVAYAQARPARNADRYKPMFAGDYVLKAPGGPLRVTYRRRAMADYKAEMQAFLDSIKSVHAQPDLDALVPSLASDLSWLESRLRQLSPGPYEHTIRIEGPGPQPIKIEIDLNSQTARLTPDWRSTAPYHHFRVEPDALLSWLRQEVTLEGLIGMRRFRVERVPERYDPKILAVINAAL